MSKQINTGDLGSLSREDLEYLRDHGKLTPEQEKQYLGKIEVNAPTAPALDEQPNTGDVGANPPDGGSPTPAAGSTDNGGSSDNEGKPYSEWLKADLEDEITKRNSEREEDDQIVPDGDLKQDLIDALELDDESRVSEE